MDVAPLASVGTVQEMFPVPPTGGSPQLAPPGVAMETKVVFVGTVSKIPAFTAAAGPLFVITIVNVMFEPATTEGDAAVLVSVRYADVAEPTMLIAVAVLFDRLGSLVPEVTLATSTICEPNVVPELTVTATLKDPLAALATSGFVQVMTPVDKIFALLLQVHPAGGVMEEKVVFAGTASLKTAFTAGNGPLFVTVCV